MDPDQGLAMSFDLSLCNAQTARAESGDRREPLYLQAEAAIASSISPSDNQRGGTEAIVDLEVDSEFEGASGRQGDTSAPAWSPMQRREASLSRQSTSRPVLVF